MRGFKQSASADLLARGYALIQNLRKGFSTLAAAVTPQLCLVTAWAQLTTAI